MELMNTGRAKGTGDYLGDPSYLNLCSEVLCFLVRGIGKQLNKVTPDLALTPYSFGTLSVKELLNPPLQSSAISCE